MNARAGCRCNFLLEQRKDRPTVAHPLRAVFAIVDFRSGGDAQRMVNGGEKILGRNRVVTRISGNGIAGAVDLSAANAAAGQESGLAPAPVVAAAGVIDPRRAAKLSH